MPSTEICLLQPNGWPQALARGLCMALGVPPVDITSANGDWQALASQLARPARAALVDLDSLAGSVSTVTRLAESLPAEVRSRIVLTRHRQGPVWPSDRAWIQSLGFADLVPDLTAGTVLTAQWRTVELLTRLLSLPPPDLPTITRTLHQWPAAHTEDDARAIIGSFTRLSAEALALDMTGHVKALTRHHRLTSYPKSLLGRETVDWLARRHELSRAQSLQVGRALTSLGFLHHVVHEHTLEDADLFYRSDCVAASIHASPGETLRLLRAPDGVEVADRIYLGRRYPSCWVGSDAVQVLHDRWKLGREEAEVLLNRLWRYALIRHVVDGHPVKDDHLYYRFQD